jgi:hypothetical protein
MCEGRPRLSTLPDETNRRDKIARPIYMYGDKMKGNGVANRKPACCCYSWTIPFARSRIDGTRGEQLRYPLTQGSFNTPRYAVSDLLCPADVSVWFSGGRRVCPEGRLRGLFFFATLLLRRDLLFAFFLFCMTVSPFLSWPL